MVSSGFSSEETIRSVILGKPYSAQEKKSLDPNINLKVDVSDLTYYLRHNIDISGNSQMFSAKNRSGNKCIILALSETNDLTDIGFRDIQDITPDISMIRNNFPCVDFYIIQENTIVFHYPGLSKCMQTKTKQELYDITMNNLITKEGYPVNGKFNVSIDNNSSMIAVTTSGNAISVSEGTYSGKFQISCNSYNQFSANTHTVSAKSNSFVFSNKNGSGSVNNIDLSILPSDVINGNIDAIYNDKNYKCKLNQLRIDPVCKIDVGDYKQLPVPVAGSIEFNGFTLDFDGSSCDKPKISIKIGPFAIQIDLIDVYRMLLVEDEIINADAKLDCVVGTLNCKLTDIKIDLNCGVFTSGKAIVYNQYLPIKFATLYFDETRCDNKSIRINIFGKDFYIDWKNVIDIPGQ